MSERTVLGDRILAAYQEQETIERVKAMGEVVFLAAAVAIDGKCLPFHTKRRVAELLLDAYQEAEITAPECLRDLESPDFVALWYMGAQVPPVRAGALLSELHTRVVA